MRDRNWVQMGCKMHPNCTQFCRFLGTKSSRKSFGMYGGDDRAPNRDLCRDSKSGQLALARQDAKERESSEDGGSRADDSYQRRTKSTTRPPFFYLHTPSAFACQ